MQQTTIENKTISNIFFIQVTQNLETKAWVNDYVFFLNDNILLKLTPSEIILLSKEMEVGNLINIPVQMLTGGYVGDKIANVIYRNVSDKDGIQIGLLLESNRIAVNTFLAGGGSILHIEDFQEYRSHNAGEWKGFWSNEII